MSSPEIILPHNWDPRIDQMPLWNYLMSGGLTAFMFAHRRWGKDDVALHFTACAAMSRVGAYWHMLPKGDQCRKSIWEMVNPHTGKRRIDEAFPDEICVTKRSQDMFIRFINGSTWQLVGSDNFNSLIGASPISLVFSEYAVSNPKAYGILSPILAENLGRAIFITTSRGKNHAYRLYKALENEEGAFTQTITVDDSGIIPQEQLDKSLERNIAIYGEDEGTTIWEQEWWCKFEGAISGSYFGKLMGIMDKESRICFAPYEPNVLVETGWDIGVGDAMAIVFIQRVGMEIRVIDYYEAQGESVQHAAKVLKEKPYVYMHHIVPHDITVREWGGEAKTRYQTALELGIKPIITVKRTAKAVDERIHAIRQALPSMWMDSKKCKVLIEHIRNYHKKWNDILKEFESAPAHGPESHGVDALGTYLTGYKPAVKVKSVSQMLEGSNRSFQGVW